MAYTYTSTIRIVCTSLHLVDYAGNVHWCCQNIRSARKRFSEKFRMQVSKTCHGESDYCATTKSVLCPVDLLCGSSFFAGPFRDLRGFFSVFRGRIGKSRLYVSVSNMSLFGSVGLLICVLFAASALRRRINDESDSSSSEERNKCTVVSTHN